MAASPPYRPALGETTLAHHDHTHAPGTACRDISHLFEGIKQSRKRFYEKNNDLMRRLVDLG